MTKKLWEQIVVGHIYQKERKTSRNGEFRVRIHLYNFFYNQSHLHHLMELDMVKLIWSEGWPEQSGEGEWFAFRVNDASGNESHRGWMDGDDDEVCGQ